MKLIYINLFIGIIIVGCSAHNDFEQVLTDTSNNNYWIKKHWVSSAGFQDYNTHFVFYENGNYDNYFSDKPEEKGRQFQGIDDGEIIKEWDYSSKDSCLTFGTLRFKVKNYNRDSILLIHFESGTKHGLFRYKK